MHALEGIRVVDLTQAEFGPRSTMILADLGADVIKIEPKQGEYTRPVTRDYDTEGINVYFLAHNRNKRGIALDYTKEKGREIIYKLVERSDIFVSTYAPGVVERHGFGYEDLSKINPRLIYVRGSGYGSKGPAKDWRGYDIAAQGWSGLLHQTGFGNPETPIGTAMVDQAGGLALALGAVSALYARERTGKGQMVSTSLLQIAVHCLAMEYTSYLLSGKEPPRSGRGLSMVRGLYLTFTTKDGALVFAGVRNEPWDGMCKVLGLEELIDDPRFATTDDREDHRAELVSILDKVFVTKTTEEWLPLLQQAGAVVAPVLSIKEAFAHPLFTEQVEANNMMVELEYPDGAKAKTPGPVVQLSETPLTIRRPGYKIGEHNYEVLLELGYTWEDIAQLITEEVL